VARFVLRLNPKRKFCSFFTEAAVVKIFMTSNLKVKNYMQVTSAARRGSQGGTGTNGT
jgi:hypothetical protein